uniref:Ig-like domain-containing protein n=1 Tax=Maylandia zebra TaxID=106582 RepID=A0A3P9D094_9CICH
HLVYLWSQSSVGFIWRYLCATILTAELRADRTAVPVGGSVTLTCSVNPSSSYGWKYYWYRDGKSYQPVTNEQISVSEGGRYSCRGGRGEQVYYTELSQSVRIDTTGEFKCNFLQSTTSDVSNRSVVTLYPNWSEIYGGETITVRCEIHGGDTEWDYEIRSASSLYSGNYRCKGRMKSSQHETTEWSDSVTLTVSDSKSYEPRPVLTVSPSWLSPGASVTLNCEVKHRSAGWSFYWYKAVPDLSEKSSSYELLPDGSGTAQDSYIIHGQTHTAGYVCRAGRGDPEYHTDHSQPKFVWSAGQFVSLCPFNELMLGHHFYSPGFRPLKSHLHDNHLSPFILKLPKRTNELNVFRSLCDQTKLNFLVSFSYFSVFI